MLKAQIYSNCTWEWFFGWQLELKGVVRVGKFCAISGSFILRKLSCFTLNLADQELWSSASQVLRLKTWVITPGEKVTLGVKCHLCGMLLIRNPGPWSIGRVVSVTTRRQRPLAPRMDQCQENLCVAEIGK